MIDYRAMVRKYEGARQHVIAGSDHELSDFSQYLDAVLAFCDAGNMTTTTDGREGQ